MKRFDHSSIAFLRVGMLLVGLALFAPGCGGGAGSTTDAASPDLPAAPDGAGPVLDDSIAMPVCAGKPAIASVTDLTGTWVGRVAAAQIVNAPIVGVMQNVYVLTMLVNISQTGTAVVADGRNCDRQQINEPTAVAPVVIPDLWASTETPVHRTGSFAVGSEGFPIFHLDAATEVVGALLASPTDTLPTSSTDPRVYDQDHDGKPGITVALTGQSLAGTLCAVQKQTTTVNAIVVSADRVEGDLRFLAEQNVLESDPPSLAQLYGMGKTGPDPTLCNSSFTMVRVPDVAAVDGGASVDGGAGVDGGGTISCDWVRANEATLF